MKKLRPGTEERLKRAKDLIKGGMPITVACTESGLSPVTYRAHFGTRKNKKSPRLVSIPVATAPQEKLVAIIGSPQAIREALREL